MMFMNQYEVDDAVNRYRHHPTLSKATRFLQRFKDMVNENSDGWAYWKPAIQSAKNLMTLIQSGNATDAQLKKAVTPIKTLCTKRNLPCPTLE